MSRTEYEKDMEELAEIIDRNIPDGIGAVLYVHDQGQEMDYFWELRKMEIGG